LSQLASTHAHETLLWASKSKVARHTFHYDLINGPDPASQNSSVWHIPAVPMREKSLGRHPTQKPLRLLRRAIVASTGEGELIFDPFCGSGTSGVVAKELGRFFVGAEMEREHVELAARRIWTAERGEELRGLPASNMDKYALTGQTLRAVVRDEPGRDLCGDEPPDVEEASPCMTLLARFLSLSRSSFHGRRLTV
jgi:DNA methylase